MDAATIAGHTPAELKSFGIPIQAAFIADGAAKGLDAVRLPGFANPNFTLGFGLPAGRLSGDTVTVRVPILAGQRVRIAVFEMASPPFGPGAAMNFSLQRTGDDARDTCDDAYVYGGISVEY